MAAQPGVITAPGDFQPIIIVDAIWIGNENKKSFFKFDHPDGSGEKIMATYVDYIWVGNERVAKIAQRRGKNIKNIFDEYFLEQRARADVLPARALWHGTVPNFGKISASYFAKRVRKEEDETSFAQQNPEASQLGSEEQDQSQAQVSSNVTEASAGVAEVIFPAKNVAPSHISKRSLTPSPEREVIIEKEVVRDDFGKQVSNQQGTVIYRHISDPTICFASFFNHGKRYITYFTKALFFVDGVHVDDKGFEKWLQDGDRSITFNAIEETDYEMTTLLRKCIPTFIGYVDYRCKAAWVGNYEPSDELKDWIWVREVAAQNKRRRKENQRNKRFCRSVERESSENKDEPSLSEPLHVILEKQLADANNAQKGSESGKVAKHSSTNESEVRGGQSSYPASGSLYDDYYEVPSGRRRDQTNPDTSSQASAFENPVVTQAKALVSRALKCVDPDDPNVALIVHDHSDSQLALFLAKTLENAYYTFNQKSGKVQPLTQPQEISSYDQTEENDPSNYQHSNSAMSILHSAEKSSFQKPVRDSQDVPHSYTGNNDMWSKPPVTSSGTSNASYQNYPPHWSDQSDSSYHEYGKNHVPAPSAPPKEPPSTPYQRFTSRSSTFTSPTQSALPPFPRRQSLVSGGPPHLNSGPPPFHSGPPPIHSGPPPFHSGPPPMHSGPPPVPIGPPPPPSGPLPVPSGPPPPPSGPPPPPSGPPPLPSGPPPVPSGPFEAASNSRNAPFHMAPSSTGPYSGSHPPLGQPNPLHPRNYPRQDNFNSHPNKHR